MSYNTEDWEYYLGKAFDTFDEASNKPHLEEKISGMLEGLQYLCEHLAEIEKKDSVSDE